MATDFTNKYMQVFQDYNEFSEHSADYVRGEDHVAFLIEENEVIYWLYLEQVWRPLNVRTTTTGQLEDGRTKVAVRLEYIEGGQKYTSVPNIPDPERITSMSHFLEDYPDIEEVNVSGTVNLTDLSYAFANSNIKNFSLLDTSNVTNWSHFIYNLDDKTLEFNIKCDVPEFDSFDNPDLYNVKIKGITFTTPNLTNDDYVFIGEDSDIDYVKGIGVGVNAAECTIGTIHSDVSSEIGWYARRQKLTNVNTINCDNTIINIGRVSDVTHNGKSLILNLLEKQAGHDFNVELNHKITTNANNIIFTQGDITYDIPFGYGIKYNENANIVINTDVTIGNFYLVTPIVDDAFYTKYNHPISIFQYKTTFEEVADVNISNEVDSSLLYVDWSSIDFDTSDMNIEINNVVQFTNDRIGGTSFNKFIIDNRDLDLDYDNYPKDNGIIDRFNANEGYISGNYVCYQNWNTFGSADSNTKLTIDADTLLENIVLWDYSYITISDANILTNNNIKANYSKAPSMPAIICNINNVDISNLKNENNIVNCGLRTYNDDYKLLYNSNITLNIIKGYYGFYLRLILDYVVNENKHTFNSNINIMSWNNYLKDTEQVTKVENVYLHGNIELNGFYSLANNIGDFEDYEVTFKVSVSNIYGENITINLPILNGIDSNEILNVYPDTDVYKHIDVYKSIASSNSYITIFQNLDNESTINLITKLVDNTDSSSKTIYMYRSQANIIGEENIAGAVAKNYEIAIIEN